MGGVRDNVGGRDRERERECYRSSFSSYYFVFDAVWHEKVGLCWVIKLHAFRGIRLVMSHDCQLQEM